MARPSKLDDALLEKARGYLNTCFDNVEVTDKGALAFVDVNLPSVVGLALYLGTDKTTIYDWVNKDSPRFNQEFSYIVKEVLQEQEQRLLNSGLGGKYAPKVVGMILSKHGYSEKMETDITTKGEAITGQALISDLTAKLNELYRGKGKEEEGPHPSAEGASEENSH